jgi:hypothetical protein
VHSNSGVLNKWYYLLVAGSGQVISSGLNKPAIDDEITDAGNGYKVKSIGFETAEAITYLAETMLTPNATFANMRDASILASQMIYGIASMEEQQVTNAWHGVDVGDAYTVAAANSVTSADAANKVLSTKSISALQENTRVYPNPAFSSLTIQLAEATIKSVVIYNTLGQTIKVVNMKTANKQANLDVASLAKGFYILKISTDNGNVFTKRFVKK